MEVKGRVSIWLENESEVEVVEEQKWKEEVEQKDMRPRNYPPLSIPTLSFSSTFFFFTTPLPLLTPPLIKIKGEIGSGEEECMWSWWMA